MTTDDGPVLALNDHRARPRRGGRAGPRRAREGGLRRPLRHRRAGDDEGEARRRHRALRHPRRLQPAARRSARSRPSRSSASSCRATSIVYERDGATHVSAVDAARMLSLVGNEELEPRRSRGPRPPRARRPVADRQTPTSLPGGPMILKQYYLGCLAHASYLVGDEGARVAAVVDPQRDVDQYLADAEAAGLRDPLRVPHPLPRRLRRGPPRAARPGRRRRSASAPAARPSTQSGRSRPATRSSSARRCGSRSSRRPGHSPESISILVYDRRAGARTPVRRADRRHAVRRRRRPPRPARRARLDAPRSSARCSTTRSSEQLLPLPDETLVYPAHGAGSLCGKNLERGDRLDDRRQQRRYNYALQPMSEGGVHPDRHGRPARRARLLHVRRRPQHEGAPDARARRSSAS